MASLWDKIKKASKTALGMTFSTPYKDLSTGANTSIGPVSNANKKASDPGVNGMLNSNNLEQYPEAGSGSSSGGSGSGAYSYVSSVKPYLDNMIAAYREGAEANKALAKSNYDNKVASLNNILRQAEDDYTYAESDLLTSLKRFQEQNAKSLENQRKSYLTDQAALESARLEADRQTRIDAAARGLGGSGLQQLAQLQNLINQGQDISNLASDNQSILETLRTQLAEQTEDINTKKEKARKVLENARKDNETGLANLLNDYNAQLQGINADLANQIANAEYNFGQSAYSAGRAGGSSSTGDDYVSVINGGLLSIQDNFADDVKSIMGNSTKASSRQAKSLKELYNTASKEARLYNTNYGEKLAGQSVNTNIKNLKSILKSYGVDV